MWLMAMKGLSGSGKSTIGRALSKHLGWPVLATWYICSRMMREKYKLKACYC
jgi:shikimate kinase